MERGRQPANDEDDSISAPALAIITNTRRHAFLPFP